MEFKHEEKHDLRLTLYDISSCCTGLMLYEKELRDGNMPRSADRVRKLQHSLLNIITRAYTLSEYDDCEEVEINHE